MAPAPLTAPELRGLRHGFFTREGGVSEGLYASLNCGPGSADAPEKVAENRARVAAALEVAPDHLLTAHQTHSAHVVAVRAPFDDRPKADALVTATPGLAVACLSADCAPILLADSKAGVVGAAHAGWRGALGGVIAAAVDAMRDLGAREIVAAIGPCISQASYEVGPDFLDAFRAEEQEFDRFFAGGARDRMMFDLPGFCLNRLRAAGVEDCGWIGRCSYAEPTRFFSHRYNTHQGVGDYGRMIAAIRV